MELMLQLLPVQDHLCRWELSVAVACQSTELGQAKKKGHLTAISALPAIGSSGIWRKGQMASPALDVSTIEEGHTTTIGLRVGGSSELKLFSSNLYRVKCCTNHVCSYVCTYVVSP